MNESLIREPETAGTTRCGEGLSPIFVDLDGSLIRTDTLWESLALLARRCPLAILSLPFWLMSGRANLKRRIADIVVPDATLLPYNREVVDHLQEEAMHRDVYLVSAADNRIVRAVADYLGFFSGAAGSSESINLKGANKLGYIRGIVGNRDFEYVGNETGDIPIWNECAKAHIVSPSASFIRRVGTLLGMETKTYKLASSLRPYLKAIRPHQWMKNALVFTPFILAHKTISASEIATLLGAFVCLSFCASSVYVFNDLLDIESDRNHPDKKRRPFAAGSISVAGGLMLAASLLVSSLGLSFAMMPLGFTLVILGYLLLTTLYTVSLKKLLIIDVLCLSSFYTIRIFAGSQASDVLISPWFFAFSSFFFLNLAFAKRYIELVNSDDDEIISRNGRGYQIGDANIVLSSGIACGFLSILVFFLYITNSEIVTELYTRPEILWFISPVLTYWISRIWILAQRRQVHSDPVLFAVKDPASWISGGLILVLVTLGAIL